MSEYKREPEVAQGRGEPDGGKRRGWVMAAGVLFVVLALAIFAGIQSANAQNEKRNANAARHAADEANAKYVAEHSAYQRESEKANDALRHSRWNDERARRWAAQARRDEERAERARRDAARDRRIAEGLRAKLAERPPAAHPGYDDGSGGGYSANPRPRPIGTAESEPAVARNDDEACRRALIYETTAASNWVSHQVAYEAAVSGLSVNAHCSEPRRTVNQAYLLAMRAPAEYALHAGDWKSDLALSDTLLDACAAQNSYRGTDVAADCLTQKRYNESFRESARRQAAYSRAK